MVKRPSRLVKCKLNCFNRLRNQGHNNFKKVMKWFNLEIMVYFLLDTSVSVFIMKQHFSFEFFSLRMFNIDATILLPNSFFFVAVLKIQKLWDSFCIMMIWRKLLFIFKLINSRILPLFTISAAFIYVNTKIMAVRTW